MFPLFRRRDTLKKLYIVRHGESAYNAAMAAQGSSWADPQIYDAQLTERGRQQARALRPQLAALDLPPDTLWLTSPLQRAMQTLLLSCPHANLLGGGGASGGAGGIASGSGSGGSSNAENSSAAPNGAGPQPPNVVVLHTITEKVGLLVVCCQCIWQGRRSKAVRSLTVLRALLPPCPAAGVHMRRHRAPRQRAAQALPPAGGPAERAAGALVALPPRQAQLRAAKVLWQPREQGAGRGE